VGAAPSFADVSAIEDVAVPAGSVNSKGGSGKGGNKGKRGARKGKGKGDGDTNPGNSENGDTAPEAVTTPLMKAKALAKAVLLDSR